MLVPSGRSIVVAIAVFLLEDLEIRQRPAVLLDKCWGNGIYAILLSTNEHQAITSDGVVSAAVDQKHIRPTATETESRQHAVVDGHFDTGSRHHHHPSPSIARRDCLPQNVTYPS